MRWQHYELNTHTMNRTIEYEYVSLMQKAEKAESRQEALYLIHAATKLMEDYGFKDHRRLVNR